MTRILFSGFIGFSFLCTGWLITTIFQGSSRGPDYNELQRDVVFISGFSVDSLDSKRRPIRYTATGSAFYFSSNLLITSLHVVDGANEIFARTSDGKSITLYVEEIFRDYDLAILRSRDAHEGQLSLVSAACGMGTRLTVVGYPSGLNGCLIAKQGILSSANVELDIADNDKLQKVWLLDIQSSRGFSGAPVIDSSNRVVGMVVGRVYDNNPNTALGAFVLPTISLLKIAKELDEQAK